MSVHNARTGDVRLEGMSDPRTRLAREKFFSQRPKPLERWLWSHRVSATAERVFWFHWTEGARTGDWSSRVALNYVAEHCLIDVSTVTRAYQALKRLGLIRRTDPGRDPSNPFEQATAVTEVLLPREFMAALNSFPDRPRPLAAAPTAPTVAPATAAPLTPKPLNPFAGLDHKQQRARIQSLAAAMSDAERQRWHRAICGTEPRMDFDPDTRIPAEIQAQILAYLASREPPATPIPSSPAPAAPMLAGPRRLSVFNVARLRRGVQSVVGAGDTAEIARQMLWAIEEGALKKFPAALAINIALKKLRQQEWCRPHRMPPKWVRQLSNPT